ncbi:hypothetical protein LZ017_20875 [Pelomonas sp. CA6]|uniref:hypothetical protein n=1 Tax=Pelomonas sp. CA6 TaxID=2907999 RepID=UPI001F4BD5E9|nr:hypothetical protein [Pelomonas sp. CA6]MCH7345833.1 hypothetical protein [Pelomonas sp. CA6]
MSSQTAILHGQGAPSPAVMPIDTDTGRPQLSPEAKALLASARQAAFEQAAQGRLGDGLHLLCDALTLDPQCHEVMADISALLLAAGELQMAADYAMRALQARPAHGPSLYTLGFARAGLGDVSGAVAALLRLMQPDARASLRAEAPELEPLAQAELARLQGH